MATWWKTVLEPYAEVNSSAVLTVLHSLAWMCLVLLLPHQRKIHSVICMIIQRHWEFYFNAGCLEEQLDQSQGLACPERLFLMNPRQVTTESVSPSGLDPVTVPARRKRLWKQLLWVHCSLWLDILPAPSVAGTYKQVTSVTCRVTRFAKQKEKMNSWRKTRRYIRDAACWEITNYLGKGVHSPVLKFV